MILLNGNPLNITVFPDNTSQVWKLPDHIFGRDSWVHIHWSFTNEGELMHLAQLKMLLDSRGVRSALRITYLPYGRQDKDISNTTTFALHTFAHILNSLDFEEVIIHDPHSSVALKLIKNSKAYFPIKNFLKVLELVQPDMLCFPDKGAQERYKDLVKIPSIYAEKQRNQDTGEITGLALSSKPMIINQKILIVDDICDGGTTFIKVAETLSFYTDEMDLYVTHGIFSKGLKPFFDSGIKRIFTQDGEASEVQQHTTYRRL